MHRTGGSSHYHRPARRMTLTRVRAAWAARCCLRGAAAACAGDVGSAVVVGGGFEYCGRGQQELFAVGGADELEAGGQSPG
jgi:hypothetical protein